VLVTNLSGPQFPLYVAGARLLDVVPIPPIAGNVTASFAVLSYDGYLDLSVHADRDSWPDLEVGLGGMRSSWRELCCARAMVLASEGLSALSA
jgi:diacylglycerol O-acyltransferase